METNKRKHLKNLLCTRINEQKMLNNTLCEMIVNHSSENSIKLIKEELKDLMAEIDAIENEIKNTSETEEVTYSFYDDVKKEGLQSDMEEKKAKEIKMGKGFYDSIVKHNKTSQFIEAEKVKDEKVKDEKMDKYNYENIYSIPKKENNSLIKKLVDEIRDTADSRIQANRFIVDLKDALNIPEIMVKSIAFDPNCKKVSICIYDFIADCKGDKHPILHVLKYAPTAFDFSVKHLDASGNVIYTEKYSKCHLMDVYRDPIDYASDDFSKIQLFISYQYVDYEASK